VLPSFNVPSLLLTEGPGLALSVLPWFALFGLMLGVLAWLLTQGIYWFEDRFDAMPGNYYTRHISGMHKGLREGLRAAASKVFHATLQRCRVHRMRNALAPCPGQAAPGRDRHDQDHLPTTVRSFAWSAR